MFKYISENKFKIIIVAFFFILISIGVYSVSSYYTETRKCLESNGKIVYDEKDGNIYCETPNPWWPF